MPSHCPHMCNSDQHLYGLPTNLASARTHALTNPSVQPKQGHYFLPVHSESCSNPTTDKTTHTCPTQEVADSACIWLPASTHPAVSATRNCCCRLPKLTFQVACTQAITASKVSTRHTVQRWRAGHRLPRAGRTGEAHTWRAGDCLCWDRCTK